MVEGMVDLAKEFMAVRVRLVGLVVVGRALCIECEGSPGA